MVQTLSNCTAGISRGASHPVVVYLLIRVLQGLDVVYLLTVLIVDQGITEAGCCILTHCTDS